MPCEVPGPVDFLFVVPVNVEDKTTATLACCYLRKTADCIRNRVHIRYVLCFMTVMQHYYAHFQMCL